MKESVVGNFQHHASSFEVAFSVSASCENSDWRKNHINACFIADFAEQAAVDLQLEDLQPSVCDTVNYVANELLEDAMVRRQSTEYTEIAVRVCVENNRVTLFITNPISVESLDSLTQRLSELLNDDPQPRYLAQLRNEGNNDPDYNTSLRYLSMMADHQVELAWKIECCGDGATLTTMSSVPLARAA